MLVGSLAFLTACEEPKEIGLPPTTPVGVYYTDTLTISRSTVLLDSVRSNGTGTLLMGRYTDPVFGRIQATGFSQLVPATQFVVQDANKNNIPDAQLVYDSTRLVLTYNFVYGDTLKTQELAVHRLTEEISRTKSYDIRSSAAYDPQPLTRFQFTPTPVKQRTQRLSLPATFGRELLALANKDAGKVDSLFQKQFKGLALVPGPNNSAMLGHLVDGSSAVLLYFHKEGDTTSTVQAFSLGAGVGRFNQVRADRSGTPLAGLRPGQSLPASATGGQTFVQPGTGVTTKLEFPTLLNLRQQGRIAINRADLIITPKQPDNSSFYLPPYLGLAEVNEQNQILRSSPSGFVQFVTSASSLFDRSEQAWVNPQIATYDSRTRVYSATEGGVRTQSILLGGYLQSILSGLTPNRGLVIQTPSNTALFSTSGGLANLTQFYLNDRLWRMVLDGSASVRLVVFYTYSN
ncbi:hypothetical protein GCM10023187_11120 [Nibrella viscosa]|uniref:DUF4270 domain-containing protein n=1 Tax=Nibrella viscosa TaxID=1084524 RepID=A0ABP8K2V0_9BACT